MTRGEKNLFIAEKLGTHRVYRYPAFTIVVDKYGERQVEILFQSGVKYSHISDLGYVYPMNYCADLNAMREAEDFLRSRAKQFSSNAGDHPDMVYMGQLYKFGGKHAVFASAEARADAFIEVCRFYSEIYTENLLK